VRTKSSADSISNGAPVAGRVAVAINRSGFPVLKKKGVSAAANGGKQADQSRRNCKFCVCPRHSVSPRNAAFLAADEWFFGVEMKINLESTDKRYKK